MCWNSKVSLNTFLFATFGLLFGILNKYNPKILLFSYSFSFMQFIEYMLWKNLKNPEQNELWSKIGLFNILVQPFVSINIIEDNKLKILLIILYSISCFTIKFSSISFNTTIGENKHLAWNWLDTKISTIVTWCFFLLAPLFIGKFYFFGSVGLLTLLISLYFYDQKTFGSMWCWSANILWLYIIAQSSGLFSKGCLY